MVEFSQVKDKQSQQRRGRADGPIESVAERSAAGENRALAPETAQESPWWPPVDREPPCAGRDSLDSAEWGPLAGHAGRICASFDLLAAVAGLGGAAHLSESLARVSERIVSGRQFRSREKRGCGVGKTKRGKGPKWMVVVNGRGLPLGEFLHSASPAEVRLPGTGLGTIRVGGPP